MSGSIWRWAAAAGLIVLCASCVTRKPPPAPAPKPAPAPTAMACTPVAADNPMVGRWYSVSTPKGVAGQMQSLMGLTADGAMTYETQLKIGRHMRPALRESGCWSYADGVYTMQTTKSSGDLVDATDPIYRNQYRVEKINQTNLTMRDLKHNQVIVARKMPAGFHLP